MKSEADRLQTFKKLQVAFMDKNHQAAAGISYTNWSDIVCCAFCGKELGHWQE